MESMAISQFKARCLAVLEQVHRSGEPVLVTRRGEPIAEIVPARASGPRRWLGEGTGTGRIVGDVVSPVAPVQEWEAAGA